MNILFLYGRRLVPSMILEAAQARLPAGYRLTLCDDSVAAADRDAMIAQADFVMLYGLPFDVPQEGRVRLLQLLSAGYDRLDLAALDRAGIPVANNGGANAQTVAEHALLLMLAVLKQLPDHHNALVDGEWIGLTRGTQLFELCDKQVGIVGLGKIGGKVARMVAAFGARPVYADVIEHDVEFPRLSKEELLATSDMVTIHTPLTPDTRAFIDAEALDRMPPHAVLINTSRGDVIDEDALIERIRAGTLGGVGLDVFEAEPLPADSPWPDLVREHGNVVITPHVAGTTLDTWWRRLAFAYANFERVAKGESAAGLIDA